MNENEINLKKIIFYSNIISYSLSSIVLFLYFSFILILGFSPTYFQNYLTDSYITYGIFSGLAIIVVSIFLTFIYVIFSNFYLDKLKNNE